MKIILTIIVTLFLSASVFAATSKHSVVQGSAWSPDHLLGLRFDGKVNGFVILEDSQDGLSNEKLIKSLTIQVNGHESISFSSFVHHTGSMRAFAVRSAWHFKYVVAEVEMDTISGIDRGVRVTLHAVDTKPKSEEEFLMLDRQRLIAEVMIDTRDVTARRLVSTVKTQYEGKDLTIKLFERAKTSDLHNYFDLHVSLLGTGHSYVRMLAGPNDGSIKATNLTLTPEGDAIEVAFEKNSDPTYTFYFLDDVLSEAFQMGFPRIQF